LRDAMPAQQIKDLVLPSCSRPRGLRAIVHCQRSNDLCRATIAIPEKSVTPPRA
jgi:hypothetical protein